MSAVRYFSEHRVLVVRYLLVGFLRTVCLSNPHQAAGNTCEVTTTGCPGQRPLTPEGCCPAPPWGHCGQESQDQCDVDLGYSCLNGVCSGEMKLVAASTSQREITITWRDFIQEHPGYQHEYSVQYTSHYTGNASTSWNRLEVGQTPLVTIEDLVPATWYFVRVGIWDDPLLQTYSLFSETLMVKTADAEYCGYYGGHVVVGDSIVLECEEKCVCRATGEFVCNIVCLRSSPELPRCTETSETGDPCCFAVEQCAAAGCVYGDRRVDDGASWLIGCDENCTCTSGDVICVPLCEHVQPPANCSQPELVKTEGDCCGVWTCHSFDGPCVNKSSELRLRSSCDFCACAEVGREDCSSLTDCGPIVLPRNSSVCSRPRITEGPCCPYIDCSGTAGDEEDEIAFTGNSLVPKTITMHIIPNEYFNQGKITLFYTNQPDNVDIKQWNRLDLVLLSNVTKPRLVPGETPIQTLTNQRGVVSLGHAHFITINSLEPMTFYYIRLLWQFKNSTNSNSTLTSKVVCVKVRASTSITAPVPFPPKTKPDFEVINVTSSSADLFWKTPSSTLGYRQFLVIRYISMATGQSMFTDKIDSSVTHFRLERLNESTVYRTSLHVLRNTTALEPALAEVVFKTNSSSETSKNEIEIEILAIKLSPYQAILQWKPFRRRYMNQIVQLEAFWLDPREVNLTYRAVVPSNATEFPIRDLKEGTFYTAWLGLLFRDGTKVFSSKIHFMTKHSPEPTHPEYHRNIVVAAACSTASIVIVIIIVIVLIYVIRFRWRRYQYQTHTSFENKIFQIPCDRDDASL